MIDNCSRNPLSAQLGSIHIGPTRSAGVARGSVDRKVPGSIPGQATMSESE